MRMLQKGSTSPIYIWVFTNYSTFTVVVFSTLGMDFTYTDTANWVTFTMTVSSTAHSFSEFMN